MTSFKDLSEKINNLKNDYDSIVNYLKEHFPDYEKSCHLEMQALDDQYSSSKYNGEVTIYDSYIKNYINDKKFNSVINNDKIKYFHEIILGSGVFIIKFSQDIIIDDNYWGIYNQNDYPEFTDKEFYINKDIDYENLPPHFVKEILQIISSYFKEGKVCKNLNNFLKDQLLLS